MSSATRRTAAALEVPIRRGKRYQSAFIDNGAVQVRSDGLGTTLSLTLLRRDHEWTGLHRSEKPGPSVAVDIYQLRGQDCVTEEFEALLEPHAAYRIMTQIRDALRTLPAEQRARYALPEEPDAPAPSDDDV